jgi:beta-1,4-mannosyltransferase
MRYRSSPERSGEGVIALYPYIETNPYQRLLSKALEELGYKIRRVPRIDSTFPFQLFALCGNVTVVHFHWIEHLYGARLRLFSPIRALVLLAIILILRSRGIRVIYTLHNLVPHNTRRTWYHLLVQGLIIRTAHATIVHSAGALSIANNTFGSNIKLKIIPHGRYDGYYPNQVTRDEAKTFLKVPDNMRVALFLGGMGGYKGIRALVAASEALAQKNILLLLAGDTSELADSDKDSVRRISQTTFMLYEGFVAESEVQYFMRSADCLVLPYLESFTSGMAFLGLGFGLPIVGTSAVAFKEMIDSKLCLPCDPNDPRSLVNAIEGVCSWSRSDFDGRRNAFLARCTWDQIARQHADIYSCGPI